MSSDVTGSFVTILYDDTESSKAQAEDDLSSIFDQHYLVDNFTTEARVLMRLNLPFETILDENLTKVTLVDESKFINFVSTCEIYLSNLTSSDLEEIERSFMDIILNETDYKQIDSFDKDSIQSFQIKVSTVMSVPDQKTIENHKRKPI